jgi:hypothetical protein
MKHKVIKMLSKKLLLAGLLLALPSSGAFAQGFELLRNIEVAQICLSDEQIQQAVVDGSILTLSEVLLIAGIGKDSKVLPPISVCDVEGVLFYQFSLLNKNGNAQKRLLPATAPIS